MRLRKRAALRILCEALRFTPLAGEGSAGYERLRFLRPRASVRLLALQERRVCASPPGSGEGCLDHDAYRDPIAGVGRVTQEIAAVEVVHVDIVRVIPADRPGLNESEPIAAAAEARVTGDDRGISDAEAMVAAKTGVEAIIGYAAVALGAETKRGLGALSLLFGNAVLRLLVHRIAVIFLLRLAGLRPPVFRLGLLIALCGLRLRLALLRRFYGLSL